MRDRTGLFKRIVSLVIAMSVLFSVGMAVSANSTDLDYFQINTDYHYGDGRPYSSDFYLTYRPGYSGVFRLYVKKVGQDSDDGLVTVYKSMTGSGTDFSDEVAHCDVTSTDYVSFDVELQNDTTYYFRFYKPDANPRYAFRLDPDAVPHSFCDVTLHSNVQGIADTTVELARGYTSYLPACPFTREGWRMIGWSDSEDGSVIYDDRGLISIAADRETLNLYAVWGYTLHFDANGGSGDPVPDYVVIPGEDVYLPNCTYTKDGATFVGWSTTQDGSGPRYFPGDPSRFTAPTTLYAQYSDRSGYEPLYQMSAENARVNVDIYVPQVVFDEDEGFVNPDFYWDGAVQIPAYDDVEIDGKLYDVYSLHCSARNMTGVHSVVITAEDDDDVVHTLFTGSISVRSYLLAIINNSSSAPETRNAAIAMLRYGAAAQIYFDGISEDNPNIANYGVAGAEISSLPSPDSIPCYATAEDIRNAFIGLECSTYYGMNIVYTDELTYMIAFRINDDSNFDDASWELRHKYLHYEYADVRLDGTRHYCILRCFHRNLLDLTSSVYTINGTGLRISDYLSRVSRDTTVRQDYRNLCLALYGFYDAANQMPDPDDD